MSDIAFIGLGAMGGPMAANLVAAGHTVRGFDLSDGARALAAANGVDVRDTVADATAGADVAFTMLPNGSIVRDVVMGQAGVLDSLAPGTVLVDSSSIDVATSAEVHEAAERAGVACIDAPVSGGIGGAAAGTLTFMVGGEASTLELVRPVLNAMGATIVHVGERTLGQAAKTCNQMLFGTTLTAVSEMFVLASSLGLDHRVLWEIVTTSTGDCRAIRNFCPVPDVVEGSPSDNDYKPGFAAPLMLKDLNLALAAAKASNQRLPLAEITAGAYSDLVEEFGALDCSAVIKTVPSRTKVSA
jgi:3-hydroxyisobutyrate dehydrogenase